MPKNHPPVIPRERSDRGNLLHKPDCNETAGKDCHEPQAALAMTGTGTFGCRSFPRFHPACSVKTLPLVRAVTGAPVPSYRTDPCRAEACLSRSAKRHPDVFPMLPRWGHVPTLQGGCDPCGLSFKRAARKWLRGGRTQELSPAAPSLSARKTAVFSSSQPLCCPQYSTFLPGCQMVYFQLIMLTIL